MKRADAEARIMEMWLKVIDLATSGADPRETDHAMKNARAAEQAFARMDLRGKFDGHS